MGVAPRDQPTTRQAIINRIADGQIIVIYEDMVLRLDSWLDKHPGGRLAIDHMVGRDATDEMKIYHSDVVLKSMAGFRIARKPVGPWHNLTPPVRGGVFTKLNLAGPPPSIVIHGVPGADHADLDVSSSDASDADSEDVTDLSSVTTDPSDLEEVCPKELDGLRRRNNNTTFSSKDTTTITALAGDGKTKLTRNEYADLLIAKEAEESRSQYPSVDFETQAQIVEKYRALHQRVRDEGFYDCHYSNYAKEIVRYSILFTVSMTALYHGWYMTSAVFLGLFWHQIMFTAHDAGHGGITHDFTTDSLIALFIADFCCGLSMGWWKSSHNVHHLITNATEHDPDIQNVPIFANCPSFFKSLKSSYYKDFVQVWDAAADFMIPYQKYTYYPIMGLARFNLYILSWCHVLSNRSGALRQGKAWWIRPTEIAFMCCYWYLFGWKLVLCTLDNWPLRVAYVLVSHLVTMPLHVQITLSHWGMPTSNIGETESFAQRQMRTTMDVDCPRWLDFIHGGLQFQAIHHLFPRVPRHNLRRLQVLVKEFSKDTGIRYNIHGFVDGNKVVLNRLEEVANQVKILVECQNYMAETGESGLH